MAHERRRRAARGASTPRWPQGRLVLGRRHRTARRGPPARGRRDRADRRGGAPKLAASQPGLASFLLALWPTIPAEEAVVRRGATSATRQRTIEANGIDCGPVSCSELRSCWRSGVRLVWGRAQPGGERSRRLLPPDGDERRRHRRRAGTPRAGAHSARVPRRAAPDRGRGVGGGSAPSHAVGPPGGSRARSWPPAAALALGVCGALHGRHAPGHGGPCLMRRATCRSFSARRSSLRPRSVLIARPSRAGPSNPARPS